MSRGLLTMLYRALREDSRALRPYALRLLLLLFIGGTLIRMQSALELQGATGLNFFQIVCRFDVVAILLLAISSFATCITEEKENATLGLLRMTELDPLAILFGKAGGRFFDALILLLCQLPFTLLAIALGGITAWQIVAAYAALIGFLLFSSGLGVLCSVIAATSRGAAGLTFVVLCGVFGVPYLRQIGFTSSTMGGFGELIAKLLHKLAEPLSWLLPTGRLAVVTRPGFSGSLWSSQMTSSLCSAAICYFLARKLFDPLNQNMAVPQPSLSDRLLRWLFDRDGVAAKVRGDPHLWRGFRQLAGGRPMFWLKVGGYLLIGIPVVVATFSQSYDPFKDTGASLTILFGGLFLVELVLTVSRLFPSELKENTLSSLAMLPQSLPSIAYRTLAGGLIGTLPSLGLLALGLFLAPALAFDLGSKAMTPAGFYSLSFLFLFLNLIANLSLRLRWGALPASIAVSLGALSVERLTCLAFTRSPYSGYSVNDDFMIWTNIAASLVLVGAVVLHMNTRRLLQRVVWA